MNTWEEFKKTQINAALDACEKHGYPTSDEPLCLLIEDALDAAEGFWNKEIDKFELVAGNTYKYYDGPEND